jgi:uncharacterized membrane protein (DUF106 family)
MPRRNTMLILLAVYIFCAVLVGDFLNKKINVTGKQPWLNNLVSAILCLCLGLTWPVLAVGLLVAVVIALFSKEDPT